MLTEQTNSGMKNYTISLTEAEVNSLKEALLAAEVSREKLSIDSGNTFKALHLELDQQLEQQGFLED